jgi:hypothetical protein
MPTPKQKAKPEFFWGTIINLTGLVFSEPRKFRYDANLNSYWYKGNYEIKRLGVREEYGYITFASTSKEDVMNFCNGAVKMCQIIRTMVSP